MTPPSDTFDLLCRRVRTDRRRARRARARHGIEGAEPQVAPGGSTGEPRIVESVRVAWRAELLSDSDIRLAALPSLRHAALRHVLLLACPVVVGAMALPLVPMLDDAIVVLLERFAMASPALAVVLVSALNLSSRWIAAAIIFCLWVAVSLFLVARYRDRPNLERFTLASRYR